jgi:hypothetical protein
MSLIEPQRRKDGKQRREAGRYRALRCVVRANGSCRFRYNNDSRIVEYERRTLKRLEARVGIEPTHKGFADLSLTTWVPRLCLNDYFFCIT